MTVAKKIDGTKIATVVRTEIKDEVAAFISETGVTPGLATVLVGDDPASAVYVAAKHKACGEVGIKSFDHKLPASTTEAELINLVEELNKDKQVNGILVQLPLPDGLDSDAVVSKIDFIKDVDGLTAVSVGRLALGQSGLRPCTPSGVIELLKRYEVPIAGANMVIIGRSQLVGKPLIQLALAENATVTVCHSKSKNTAEICSQADIVVAAAGSAGLVTAEHVRDGAVVIDVGTNRVDGKLVGDVDFAEVSKKASLITPVPGGVGPMTITFLLRNTLEAAKMQLSQ